MTAVYPLYLLKMGCLCGENPLTAVATRGRVPKKCSYACDQPPSPNIHLLCSLKYKAGSTNAHRIFLRTRPRTGDSALRTAVASDGTRGSERGLSRHETSRPTTPAQRNGTQKSTNREQTMHEIRRGTPKKKKVRGPLAPQSVQTRSRQQLSAHPQNR